MLKSLPRSKGLLPCREPVSLWIPSLLARDGQELKTS